MNVGSGRVWLLMLFLCFAAWGAKKCDFASLAKEFRDHQSVFRDGETAGIAPANLKRLLEKTSPAELAIVERFLSQLARREAITREDYSKFAEILRRHRADGFLQFHTTVEGTIEKILTSQIDGRVQPHLRPGSYEWTVYTLTTPANQSPWGAIRSLSVKSQGKETIVFQGEAADLFHRHPPTGFLPFYKWLNGERVIGMNRIVIDEYKQTDEQTLVVTKAHLEPLRGAVLVRAYVGVFAFHATEILLGTAGIICLLGNC